MTKAKQAQIIEELKNFEFLNKKSSKSGNKAPQFKLCERVRKGTKELQDTTKQLRHKVADRRENVVKLISDLTSPEGKIVSSKVVKEKSVSALEGVPVRKKKVKVSKSVAVATTGETVRVAGRVNEDRCARCEELDDEEVCGDNGKTYRTLCHAVNCAGLALRDISVGSCAKKVLYIINNVHGCVSWAAGIRQLAFYLLLGHRLLALTKSPQYSHINLLNLQEFNSYQFKSMKR